MIAAAAGLLNIGLVEEVTDNPDNVDHGEINRVHDGSAHGVTSLTGREIDCIQKLLADIRAWPRGVRQLLVYENFDQDTIERIMADGAKGAT